MPNYRGLLFIGEDRIMEVLFPHEPKSFTSSQPTEQEKAMAMDATLFTFASLQCEGNKAAATYIYSKDPKQKGQSYQIEFAINNNEIKYRPIHATGSDSITRIARRVESMDKAANNGCGRFLSFWEYTHEMEGVQVNSKSYFAWIEIHRKFWDAHPDVSTENGKARAFDSIYVGAGKYYCEEKPFNPTKWVLLYDKNPKEINNEILTEQVFNEPSMRFWLLDKNRKRTSITGTTRRLENSKPALKEKRAG